MMDPAQLLPFALASALVIGVPGPATFLVLGQAQVSRHHAARTTLGIVLGDMVLMTASALGFAVLVTQWPLLLLGVKLGGAAYLVYLAWGLWHSYPASESVTSRRDNGFVKGLLLTLSNPKPVLFFAAFFPLFIPQPTSEPLHSFATLGLVFEVLNLAYFTALVGLLGLAGKQPGFQRFLAGSFNRVAAAGLLLCAVLMVGSLRA